MHLLDDGPSFTCPQCGRISHHPTDVEQQYCGFCHQWNRDQLIFYSIAREVSNNILGPGSWMGSGDPRWEAVADAGDRVRLGLPIIDLEDARDPEQENP